MESISPSLWRLLLSLPYYGDGEGQSFGVSDWICITILIVFLVVVLVKLVHYMTKQRTVEKWTQRNTMFDQSATTLLASDSRAHRSSVNIDKF